MTSGSPYSYLKITFVRLYILIILNMNAKFHVIYRLIYKLIMDRYLKNKNKKKPLKFGMEGIEENKIWMRELIFLINL